MGSSGAWQRRQPRLLCAPVVCVKNKEMLGCFRIKEVLSSWEEVFTTWWHSLFLTRQICRPLRWLLRHYRKITRLVSTWAMLSWVQVSNRVVVFSFTMSQLWTLWRVKPSVCVCWSPWLPVWAVWWGSHVVLMWGLHPAGSIVGLWRTC